MGYQAYVFGGLFLLVVAVGFLSLLLTEQRRRREFARQKAEQLEVFAEFYKEFADLVRAVMQNQENQHEKLNNIEMTVSDIPNKDAVYNKMNNLFDKLYGKLNTVLKEQKAIDEIAESAARRYQEEISSLFSYCGGKTGSEK
ncbi:MAG: hypothetical protein ACOX7J_00215 [Bacillota bacterium]|jgi:hypothetical protein